MLYICFGDDFEWSENDAFKVLEMIQCLASGETTSSATRVGLSGKTTLSFWLLFFLIDWMTMSSEAQF